MRALFRGIRFLFFALMVLVGIFVLLSASPKAHAEDNPLDAQSKTAYLLTIDGAIGPAVADYLVRGIVRANKQKAGLVIIQMDTPGGLAKSMRDIIVAINQSQVPVVSFVHPAGARAASAGTFILYGSHVAAMTPGTNLGAASPVAIGMPQPATPDEENKEETGESAQAKDKKASKKAAKPSLSTASQRKAMNDAVAYIRGLAELRDRNADWAEEAVRKASSITYKEALKKNVIDVVADDMSQLMSKIDGRKVQVNSKPVRLSTKNIVIKKVSPDARARFLGVITDPTFAYMLMLVGVYGILIEVIYPGMIVPGVLGVISLLIALYAFALLPINYVGLALIAVGFAFMIFEGFVSSYGILGIGGVIAFIIGSIMLIDTDIPTFKIAIELIISVALVIGFTMVLILNMALRSRFRPAVSGTESLIGAQGTVTRKKDAHFSVRVAGEIWQADCDQSLEVGQKVTVTEVNGLVLNVTPVE